MITKKSGIAALAAVLVLSGLGASSSAVTPSPKMNGRVAFQSALGSGDSDIYSANQDKSDLRQLTHSEQAANPTLIRTPAYSPDGKKIAYSKVTGTDDFNIFVMNADGSNNAQVSNLTGDYQWPSWSPDGSKIAFSGYVPDHTNDPQTSPEILMMNADGSNVTHLTSSSNGTITDLYPSWSPDGSKIAFVRYDQNQGGKGEIYTYDTSSQAVSKLSNFNDQSVYGVSWSPDGSRLVTSATNNGSLNLYTLNADGSNVQQINFCTNKASWYPEWSPDGKKLMFSTNCYNSDRDIVITDLDGSNPVNLGTAHVDEWDVPSWQPVTISSSSTSNGVTVNTISSDQSDTNYWVDKNTVLVVDGAAGSVDVASGGTLKGHGTTGAVNVLDGGKLAPGNSPGCIASSGLTFAGGAIYEVEISGTAACSQYDQTVVTGSVNLGGATLDAKLLDGFTGKQGDTFRIIDNDGNDPVTGMFSGLAEGSTVKVGGTVFVITYAGGDGNDVVLTVQNSPVPGVPDTGFQLVLSTPLVAGSITLISAGALIMAARKKFEF